MPPRIGGFYRSASRAVIGRRWFSAAGPKPAIPFRVGWPDGHQGWARGAEGSRREDRGVTGSNGMIVGFAEGFGDAVRMRDA
jgi:hypothetical protein